MPDYRTGKGTPYSGLDISITECPVSFITPQSKELVARHFRMRRAWECGVQTWPPGQMLARDVDALIRIESEESRLEKAKYDAEEFDGRDQ